MLLVLKLEYSWIIWPIAWVLMPWLLAWPGHQWPWYWPCSKWVRVFHKKPWPCFNIKTAFPDMGISMFKIRRSRDRLIYNMGIPIGLLVRRHLFVETVTCFTTTRAISVLENCRKCQCFMLPTMNSAQQGLIDTIQHAPINRSSWL